MKPTARVALCAPLLAALAGCGTPSTAPPSGADLRSSGRAPSDLPRTAAMVDGQPIQWADLLPVLAEASGGAAVQEAVLDIRLEREIRDNKLAFPGGERAAIEREREIFIGVLEQARRSAGLETAVSRDDAERLLADVRRGRGLGDTRFAALLRRSAMLRLLAAADVRVEESAVATLYQIRYGEKRSCRIIVTALQDRAASLHTQLTNPPESERTVPLAARFALAAGLLGGEPAPRIGPGTRRPGSTVPESFSVLDTAYAASVRQVAATLQPGQMSPVIAVDGGFAILFLEAIEPPAGPAFEQVRGELSSDLQSRLERLRMDAIVSELLARPGVTVLDRSLNWSVENLAKNPTPR